METGCSSSKRDLSSYTSGCMDDDGDNGGGKTSFDKKKRKRYKKKKKLGEKETVARPFRKLYKICKEVFSKGGGGCAGGYIPTPIDIAKIKSVLDEMRAENVNIGPDMEFFKESNDNNNGEKGCSDEHGRVISYLHIYKCSKFSIGIFFLPPSAVIPLHDHPGMTVFSKLFFGSLHVKSYDWVANTEVISGDITDHIIADQTQRRRTRLAKVHVDSDIRSPCETSVLFPAAGGNIHCFRAVTACAILDVLIPPYSESEGRHCKYYQDFPFSRFSSGTAKLAAGEDMRSDQYKWLEEIDKPEQFVVV